MSVSSRAWLVAASLLATSFVVPRDAGASVSAAGIALLPDSPRHGFVRIDWEKLGERALNGDSTAAAELGTMYAQGRVMRQDIAEAMRWLTRAVAGGSVEARRELGLLLLRGQGFPGTRNMQ